MQTMALILLLLATCTYCTGTSGYATRIQKSTGITIVANDYESIANESDNANASRVIDDVLTDVVHESMNDMVQKLSASLRRIFEQFGKADGSGSKKTRHFLASTLDEQESYDFSHGNLQSLQTKRGNDIAAQETKQALLRTERREENGGDTDASDAPAENRQQYLEWFQNALMNMFNKGHNRSAQVRKPLDNGQPLENSSNDTTRPAFTVSTPTTIASANNVTKTEEQNFTIAEEAGFDLSALQLFNFTFDGDTPENGTLNSELQIPATPHLATASQNNDTFLTADMSTSPVPVFSANTSESNETFAPGAITAPAIDAYNTTVMSTAQQVTTTTDVSSTTKLTRNHSFLITGLPDDNNQTAAAFKHYVGQDSQVPAVQQHDSSTSPRPVHSKNDPSDDNSPSPLLLQTVLISAAAALAILVFGVAGLLLACFRKRADSRRRRRRLQRTADALGRWSSSRTVAELAAPKNGRHGVASLSPDTLTHAQAQAQAPTQYFTSASAGVQEPNEGRHLRYDSLGAAQVNGKSAGPPTPARMSSPFYYDSSKSDWSLISATHDRQVDTYFACPSVMNMVCTDAMNTSPSTPAVVQVEANPRPPPPPRQSLKSPRRE